MKNFTSDISLAVDPRTKVVIDEVELGLFDDILELLQDTYLGIYTNSYVDNDTVKPMPLGYRQIESNLSISVAKHRDCQNTSSVQVGWCYGSDYSSDYTDCQSHCWSHNPPKDLRSDSDRVAKLAGCSLHSIALSSYSEQGSKSSTQVGQYSHGRADCTGTHCSTHDLPRGDDEIGLLKNAQELYPKEISKGIGEYNDMLEELAKHNLGIFICHGHNSKYEFTELPIGCVSVVKDNKTQFSSRDEVLGDDCFVPNVWRFEDGVRQAVGGYSA